MLPFIAMVLLTKLAAHNAFCGKWACARNCSGSGDAALQLGGGIGEGADNDASGSARSWLWRLLAMSHSFAATSVGSADQTAGMVLQRFQGRGDL